METRYANITVWVYAVYYWIKALVLFIAALGLIFLTEAVLRIIISQTEDAELPPWPPGVLESLAGGLGIIVGIFLLLFALLFLAIGIGLLMRKNWARISAIVFSVFDLLSFPVGTLIGGYAIYAFGFDEEMRKQFGLSTGQTVVSTPSKTRKKTAKSKK